MVALEATLERIESQVAAADFELIKRLFETLAFIMRLMRAQRTTIARLRRLFGLSSSEKTRDILPSNAGASSPGEPPGDEGAAAGTDPVAEAGNTKDIGGAAAANGSPDKPKGHGRLSASDYTAATQIPVAHECLAPGQRCPDCKRGTLYELKEPARLLRIIGQPVLAARCWNCQRLRCSGCGHVYTARAPEQARGPKFDETATSMIALCRYGAGLPHNRLERLQKGLETPVPSSTQWDVLADNAPAFRPVFDEMARQAAQGSVIHDDDTYARVLQYMGKRRAKLLKNGELPNPDRTGLFTTGILSVTDDGPIALFYTGRKYAGENLADLLELRDPERQPPILMSDALDTRNVPKGHTVIEANCNAHARRGIVDQVSNFPVECEYVLQMLSKVFVIDAQCKREELSPEQRLLVHQRESRPVMNELHQWMNGQFTAKQVEPNSGLGRAYTYMLKRWAKLTLFLRKPGAPIDNNICERALKKAICHRRNSLFYRSQHGAQVGDMFTSFIHTAELRGANPFEFLTQVQRHAKAAAHNPSDWLPWNYRATLARLAER